MPLERREASACTSLTGNWRSLEDRQHFPAHVARGTDDGDGIAHFPLVQMFSGR